MPHAVAAGLRRRGIDVTTAREADLLGQSDRSILAFAAARDYVVVTADDDFFALSQAVDQHAGIVYYRQRQRSIGEVISGLVLIHGVLAPGDMVGQVEFL